MRIFNRPVWSFIIVKGDIFDVQADCGLAHSIGSDLLMRSGIAAKFKRKFGRLRELRTQNAQPGEIAVLKVNNQFVYYLMTKRTSTQKIRISNLRKSLTEMKKHMKVNGVMKIAMPMLEGGLADLKWEHVFRLLERVFSKSPIQLILYDV